MYKNTLTLYHNIFDKLNSNSSSIHYYFSKVHRVWCMTHTQRPCLSFTDFWFMKYYHHKTILYVQHRQIRTYNLFGFCEHKLYTSVVATQPNQTRPDQHNVIWSDGNNIYIYIVYRMRNACACVLKSTLSVFIAKFTSCCRTYTGQNSARSSVFIFPFYSLHIVRCSPNLSSTTNRSSHLDCGYEAKITGRYIFICSGFC